MSPTRIAALLLAILGVWLGLSGRSHACDEFASRLIKTALRPAIESLGCPTFDQAGLDKADHKLIDACYTSEGATSTLALEMKLSCRTGPGATLQASISETITAVARVRGSDCEILEVNVDAGDFATLLIQVLNGNTEVRRELQDALDRICR